ncbi:MAG: response regulator transcription factor [Ilumatobacteraceae bacterium]
MAARPTVLVADDNADICDLLQVGLSKLAVDVEVANNGREAYEKILAHKPSLVLLDLVMPELTGLEVLAKLRETAEFSSLPVIMITARTQDDDIERGFKLGATDYVIKPFNLKELMTKAAAILKLS